MSLPVVTVGALIFDPHDRVLVVKTHKWRDAYGIPGGKIELGETMEAALVREIREETGLPLHDVRFVLAQDAVYSEEFYKPAHFVLLNFTARTDAPERLVLNDEAQSARWVSLDEALALPLNTPTRALVAHVRQEPPVAR